MTFTYILEMQREVKLQSSVSKISALQIFTKLRKTNSNYIFILNAHTFTLDLE